MNNNYLDIWHLNSTWSILSSICSGDKIGINGNLVTIHKQNPLIWIKRKMSGNSRDDVFRLITDLIEMTNYHLKEDNHIKNDVDSFKHNIINGVYGLINLRSTYIEDSRFLSIFNSYLEKIKQLKHYFNSDNERERFDELEKKIFMRND
jgi:hypothetical protein